MSKFLLLALGLAVAVVVAIALSRWLLDGIAQHLGVAVAAMAGAVGLWGIGLAARVPLAKQNRFFTTIQEGTARIILKGDSFDRAVMAAQGRDFRRNVGPVSGLDRWVAYDVVDSPNPKFRGGFSFYGLYPFRDILKYNWEVVLYNEEGKKEVVREKRLFVDLKEMILWVELDGNEDVDLRKVRYLLAVRGRFVNPLKMLYEKPEWFAFLLSELATDARKFTSDKKFEVLARNKNQTGAELGLYFKEQPREPGGPKFNTLKHIEEECGFRLLEVNIIDVTASQADIDALQAPEKARLAGEATKATAQAESDAMEIRAAAEAKRIATITQALRDGGEDARLQRMLEVLERAPGGPVSMQFIPGLPQILGGNNTAVDAKTIEKIVRQVLAERQGQGRPRQGQRRK